MMYYTSYSFQFGTGIWHEMARYPNEFELTNCGSYEFSYQGDKVDIRLLGDSIVPKDSPNYIESVTGIAPGAGSKGVILNEISTGCMYQ